MGGIQGRTPLLQIWVLSCIKDMGGRGGDTRSYPICQIKYVDGGCREQPVDKIPGARFHRSKEGSE